jgi:hypothetical protein
MAQGNQTREPCQNIKPDSTNNIDPYDNADIDKVRAYQKRKQDQKDEKGRHAYALEIRMKYGLILPVSTFKIATWTEH